ncbi:MAG: hypothetical protein GY816_18045 [Cytophagales bacterium]|nr:hypothetical protein [Cytophagales bacterium]
MNAFSERIINEETDMDTWKSRLNEGQEKFRKRFGDYELSDFSYDFDKNESKLIIYFRKEEQVRMTVVKEGKTWKLDEK